MPTHNDETLLERYQREAEALFKAMPVLKDPVKGKQVWDNIVTGAGQFGFSPQEVNGFTDHRLVLALRKAIAYDRIKSSAPTVQADVAKRPPMRSSSRATAATTQVRAQQERTEQLRKTGRLDAAVASLMDFDL